MPSSGPVAGRIPLWLATGPVYLWRCDVRLSSSVPLVLVLVVSEAPIRPACCQQRCAESSRGFYNLLAAVAGGRHP